MTQKKIAFVVKYFPTVSETFIVNQINALIDQGYYVTLYSYNNGDYGVIHESLLKHDLLRNVNYFVKPNTSKVSRLFNALKLIFKNKKSLNWSLLFKSINIFKYGKEAYTLKLFYESQWFLVRNDFDIIHAHFGMNAKRIAHLKHLGFIPKRIKLVTTFHGYDLLPNKESFYQEHYKFVFQFSNVITVNTKYMLSLIHKIRKDIRTVKVLPVGLDTTFFKSKGPKKRSADFRIVFCGRFVEFKAPDMVIKVIDRLHEIGYHNVILDLIGEGDMKKELKEQVEARGIENSVKFHGSLSQKEIRKQFEKAHVFLLPGRYNLQTGRAETQGLVIQEAQAMELPVIVSDVGGMKYGLIDGETGFVVKENDIDGFVRCIEGLILDNDLRKKIGERGRRFVEENYDNKLLADSLISIYNSI